MGRSVTVSIATSESGFKLSVVEKETVKDKDLGQSHTEAEKSSQDFGVYKSAVDAATAVLKKFEGKLGKAEGELFK